MKTMLPPLLSFAVLVSVAGLACAANTITLNCTGTLWSEATDFKDKSIPPQSLFINFDRKTVTGGFGDFSITGVTSTHVMFEAPPSREGELPIKGHVDRVTGSASIYALRSDGNGMVWSHTLSCNRANQAVLSHDHRGSRTKRDGRQS